jgi:phosphoenolpyruvate-protein kinase (PTS system EI component)
MIPPHYEFTGLWLIPEEEGVSSGSFQLVQSLHDWQVPTDETKKFFYVVPSLSSDFLTLFPSCRALLTCTGSQLSHLAILAREQQVPIFLIQDSKFETLSGTGTFTLKR